MALVKCAECAADLSDKAASCPKCGHPTASAGGVAPGESKSASVNSARKKPMTTLAVVGATLGGIALALVIAYNFVLGSGARKEIAAAVSDTPIGQHIVPWPDKAESAVRKLLSGASGANVGASIQSLAHPTGKEGVITNVDVRHMGDQLSVRIDESWRGGFLGSKNTTTIVWDFDQRRHIRARVMGDSGALGVDQAHAAKLDQYFASELYPLVRNNVGE